MSEVQGVVVAHGQLARCLVETANAIAGVTEGLVPISNDSCDPPELQRRIRKAMGDGPAIVFVDLASGSCAHAARSVSHGHGRVAVITGANLPMLLDYLFHRDLDLDPLTERLVSKGRDGTVAYRSESEA